MYVSRFRFLQDQCCVGAVKIILAHAQRQQRRRVLNVAAAMPSPGDSRRIVVRKIRGTRFTSFWVWIFEATTDDRNRTV